MSGQEEVYNNVLAAMNASLSSSTSREDRTRADSLLSQLKDSQLCMEVLLYILNFDNGFHNDYIRMLALTIFNDWLNIWWNRISESDQIVVRHNVLRLLSGNIGNATFRGLHTKLAGIISNIATRSFPQLWPTFIDDMISILSENNANKYDPLKIQQKELIIMTIEFTAADSIDTDYCSTTPLERRQDILSGFRSKLIPLLSFTYSYLITCSNDYILLLANNNTQREPQRVLLLKLMSSLCKMMCPIAMFSKPEDICDANANRDFALLAVQMLQLTPCGMIKVDDSLWELHVQVVKLLHILTSHKLPLDVFSRLVNALPQHVPYIIKSMNNPGGGNEVDDSDADLSEKLSFQRTYAEMVFSLLSENITQAVSRYSDNNIGFDTFSLDISLC